jgi:hypothetical protein
MLFFFSTLLSFRKSEESVAAESGEYRRVYMAEVPFPARNCHTQSAECGGAVL